MLYCGYLPTTHQGWFCIYPIHLNSFISIWITVERPYGNFGQSDATFDSCNGLLRINFNFKSNIYGGLPQSDCVKILAKLFVGRRKGLTEKSRMTRKILKFMKVKMILISLRWLRLKRTGSKTLLEFTAQSLDTSYHRDLIQHLILFLTLLELVWISITQLTE